LVNAARTDQVLRVGTRGSALARRQADLVIDALRRLEPELSFEVEIIRTLGDEAPQVDLSLFEGQGIFVRAIETALLEERIDFAVHSFKDMPSRQPDGLAIGAFPPRDDPRDALVTAHRVPLHALASGAVIGTGSPRRRALVLSERSDLDVRPIRGNVDTRLRRVADGNIDGVVLAAAGLARLGRSGEIAETLDPRTFTPAVGQGILAVQARAGDVRVIGLLGSLDHQDTRACATAERAVADEVGAGCQFPFGAYARINGTQLEIDAFLAIADDGALLRAHVEGPAANASAIGTHAGAELILQRDALAAASSRSSR
jgi:hydroxymethylbilane synthase